MSSVDGHLNSQSLGRALSWFGCLEFISGKVPEWKRKLPGFQENRKQSEGENLGGQMSKDRENNLYVRKFQNEIHLLAC